MQNTFRREHDSEVSTSLFEIGLSHPRGAPKMLPIPKMKIHSNYLPSCHEKSHTHPYLDRQDSHRSPQVFMHDHECVHKTGNEKEPDL